MIGKSMVAAIVVAMLLVQWSHAKSVDVGGSAGWTSFESSHVTSPNYKAWASSQKLNIGDRLVFKFEAGVHNVWKLQSLAAYQKCDFSGAALLDAGDSGFYIWKATEAGEYYFSCDKGAEGVGTHCNYNQKLAIVVSKAAAAAPSPSATPPSPLPHPPLPLTPLPAPWNSHSPGFSPAPAPSSSPVPGPWHSPAPAVDAPAPLPFIYPVPEPSLSPVPAPLLGPVPAPLLGPVPAPLLGPVPAPLLSPVPAPSLSPAPAPSLSPAVTAPSPESSSPIPDMPDLAPPAALVSPSQNGGMFMSATQPSASSSLLASLALLCVLL